MRTEKENKENKVQLDAAALASNRWRLRLVALLSAWHIHIHSPLTSLSSLLSNCPRSCPTQSPNPTINSFSADSLGFTLNKDFVVRANRAKKIETDRKTQLPRRIEHPSPPPTNESGARTTVAEPNGRPRTESPSSDLQRTSSNALVALPPHRQGCWWMAF